MLICPDTFLAYRDERAALSDGCDLSRLWRVEVEPPPELQSFFLLTDRYRRTVAILDVDVALRWIVNASYAIRIVTMYKPDAGAPARAERPAA